MSKIKDTLPDEEARQIGIAEGDRKEEDREYGFSSEIRLATDQFCYINFQFYGSREETIAEYRRIKKLYEGVAGLPEREFCQALDRYLSGDGMSAEVYEGMSKEQQDTIQCLKRAFKRIKSRQ